MVTFEVRIEHRAEDEAGMLAFLTHIKDNYADCTRFADADSRSHMCRAEIQFTTLNLTVSAILDFRSIFSIDYKIKVVAI